MFVVIKTDPLPTWRAPSEEDRKRYTKEVTIPSDGEASGVNGLTFEKLSKLYGTAYLQEVYDAYSCLDSCMTDEEFCKYYGNIPKGFFEKKIKHHTHFQEV